MLALLLALAPAYAERPCALGASTTDCVAQIAALEAEGQRCAARRAWRRLEAACEDASCARVAMGYLEGSDPDTARAAALAEAGCRAGHGADCELFGAMVVHGGYGVTPDPDRARRALAPACEGGSSGGCRALLFLAWGPYGTSAERAQADAWLERACDGEDPERCLSASWSMLWGTLLPQDVDRARDLLERSCAAGAGESCHQLGVEYTLGERLPKDPAAAESWFGRGCDAGHAASCDAQDAGG